MRKCKTLYAGNNFGKVKNQKGTVDTRAMAK